MSGWEANWNRNALERIVALLFALAGLADRAAGAPFFRRRQVLGILSQGEAEARAFIIGVTTGAPFPADAQESTGDGGRLAVGLRALALVLCALMARRLAHPGAPGPQAGRPANRISGPAVRRLSAPATPAPDTS
jgi:hypothetical protein